MAMNRASESDPVPRAVLFTDIVGSTQFFAQHGDQAGLRLVERHNRAIFPLIESADGRVVKTLGDGVLAVFEDPRAALRVGFALQRTLASLESRFHVRVGVHYGLVVEKDGDVFGDVVNLTERVKSAGPGDQVLASRTLRDMVKNDPRFKLQSIGIRELKGSPEPMEIFELLEAPPLAVSSVWRRAVKRIRRRALLGWGALLVAAAAAAGWLAQTPPAPSAVAVLPFHNAAKDKDIEYLSVALAEELNTQLRSVGAVHVRPLSSLRGFSSEQWDAAKLKERVQVDTVVEGSYIRSPSGLRLNVAIVDLRENRQVWAEQFDEPEGDLLKLLDRASRRVVGALRLRLSPFEYGTRNSRAYDAYLRGLSMQLETTNDRCEEAIRSLEEAVRLDGGFARGYAALSRSQTTRFWWNFSNDRTWLDRAEKSARRCLELDANLAEGHYSLAYALEAQGKRADCIRESVASFRLDRQYAPALLNLARYAFYMGEFDAALDLLDRMALVDPASNVSMRKAIYLFFAGRSDQSRAEALKAEARAIGVDEYTLLAICYAWLNDLESADRMLKLLESKDPAAPSRWEVRAWILTARGKFEEARKEMELFSNRQSWGIAQGMAALYAIQGDAAKAQEWLDRAVSMGAPSYAWFSSPHFALLRGKPAYESVLGRFAEEYAPLRAEFRTLR